MEKYETILVEPGEQGYNGISFKGINTKMHFAKTNEVEILKEIKPILEKELLELWDKEVENYKLQDPKKKKVLVVRKISPELIKIMDLRGTVTSAFLVSPMPIKNPKTLKYEYTVFGYSSAVVTEK